MLCFDRKLLGDQLFFEVLKNGIFICTCSILALRSVANNTRIKNYGIAFEAWFCEKDKMGYTYGKIDGHV